MNLQKSKKLKQKMMQYLKSCFDYMIEIESKIKEESQEQADRFQDFYAEKGEEGICFYNKIFQKELSISALLIQELFCVKSFMKSI